MLNNDTKCVSELGRNVVTALPHIASISVVFGGCVQSKQRAVRFSIQNQISISHLLMSFSYFFVIKSFNDIIEVISALIFVHIFLCSPIPVVASSKGLSKELAGILGSNPTRDMNVSLLWVLCVVR